ncbi:hypothetical protein C8Q77DRAFT_849115 [Trametes polyzona]|nr:hypothetical protein C8Q77DRAFT_849115 [Trametes polyzona]
MDSSIPGEVIIESNHTNRILSSIAFALLYYDFVLTIPQEVERYWRRKFSFPSFLFYLNRYMSVLSHIPVIIEFFGVFPETFQQYHRFISILIQGVVAALMVLRTYALYGRDKRILALLLVIIGTGGIISIWVLVVGRRTRRPTIQHADVDAVARIGCDLTLSQEEGYDLAIAWSAILVFDATVFVLTLLQSLRIGRAWSGGYFRIMLRDGTVYFAAMFVCYLSNILAYALAKPVHKGVSTSITNVVSTTLIARLMLNIRDPNLLEGPHRWGTSSYAGVTTC